MRTVPALVLLALLTTGCPPPAPDKTKTGPAAGKTPTSKTAAGGKTTGTDPAQTDPKQSGGASGPTWSVISQDLVDHPDYYPMLKPTASWPTPGSLKPVSSLPEAQRPSATQVQNLKELVTFIVSKDLRPKDMDAALGVDGQGRLFMKLGKTKPEGSASLQVRQAKTKFPVFCMTLQRKRAGKQTIDSLRKQVASVVTSKLAKHLSGLNQASKLSAWPQHKGDAVISGMAMLDRQQAHGTQFPYLYGFSNGTHLVVLLQEVPHMTAPR